MISRTTHVSSQGILPFLVLSLCIAGCRSSPRFSGESSFTPELPALIAHASGAERHYRQSLLGRSGTHAVEAVIVPDMNTESLLIIMFPMRLPVPSFATYEGSMFIDEELIEVERAVDSIVHTSRGESRIRILWCTPRRYRSEMHNSTHCTFIE